MRTKRLLTGIALVVAANILTFRSDWHYAEGTVFASPASEHVFGLSGNDGRVAGAVITTNFHSRQLDWGWGQTFIGPTPKPGEFGKAVHIRIWRRSDRTLFQSIQLYWR